MFAISRLPLACDSYSVLTPLHGSALFFDIFLKGFLALAAVAFIQPPSCLACFSSVSAVAICCCFLKFSGPP